VPEPSVLTIGRPEQLKALGHPLRLRVLEVLGESGEQLTNRQLAVRLGVDPGHLHFHVRMLLAAGLIELAPGEGRREKPYRAVASSIRVAPELIATGEVNDMRAAMLDAVQRGWHAHADEGNFRAAQITVRIDPDRIRDAFEAFSAALDEHEDPAQEPMLITVFAHPYPGGDSA
jgi:DNA-binding transcriptional ArsR family regulator